MIDCKPLLDFIANAEHGDVVPIEDGYGEREQGNLPDVQDDILGSINSRHRERQDSLPE